MSLFICSNCGCIENTKTIRTLDKSTRSFKYLSKDGYPCMGIAAMSGCGLGNDIDVSIIRPDKPIKKANEVMMLCCECNTGLHHNLFPKEQANDLEKEIASYSKYNMITPYDHKGIRLIACSKEEARNGYKIIKNTDYPKYDKKVELFKNLDINKSLLLNTYSMLRLNPNNIMNKKK